MRALRDFLNSSVSYEELSENIGKATTVRLEIEGSWGGAVEKEIANFSQTIGANIMNLFIDTSPRALIKIPNQAYPKDKSVEGFFLDNFEGYFDRFRRELDCETFWNLIDRFLGNNGKNKSPFFHHSPSILLFFSFLFFSLFSHSHFIHVQKRSRALRRPRGCLLQSRRGSSITGLLTSWSSQRGLFP